MVQFAIDSVAIALYIIEVMPELDDTLGWKFAMTIIDGHFSAQGGAGGQKHQ